MNQDPRSKPSDRPVRRMVMVEPQFDPCDPCVPCDPRDFMEVVDTKCRTIEDVKDPYVQCETRRYVPAARTRRVICRPPCESDLYYCRPATRPLYLPLRDQQLKAAVKETIPEKNRLKSTTIIPHPQISMVGAPQTETITKKSCKIQYVGGTLPIRGIHANNCAQLPPEQYLVIPKLDIVTTEEIKPAVLVNPKIERFILPSDLLEFCECCCNTDKEVLCIGKDVKISVQTQSEGYRYHYDVSTETEDCPQGPIIKARSNPADRSLCTYHDIIEKAENIITTRNGNQVLPANRPAVYQKRERMMQRKVCRQCGVRKEPTCYITRDTSTDYTPMRDCLMVCPQLSIVKKIKTIQVPACRAHLSQQCPGDGRLIDVSQQSKYAYLDEPCAYPSGRWDQDSTKCIQQDLSACKNKKARRKFPTFNPDCDSLKKEESLVDLIASTYCYKNVKKVRSHEEASYSIYPDADRAEIKKSRSNQFVYVGQGKANNQLTGQKPLEELDQKGAYNIARIYRQGKQPINITLDDDEKQSNQLYARYAMMKNRLDQSAQLARKHNIIHFPF